LPVKKIFKILRRLPRWLYKGEVVLSEPIPALHGRNLFYAQVVVREGRRMIVLKIGQDEYATDVWLDKNGTDMLREFLANHTVD
jgi:hypothetical protein